MMLNDNFRKKLAKKKQIFSKNKISFIWMKFIKMIKFWTKSDFYFYILVIVNRA